MPNSIKHSFIILAYKKSPYLTECIDSLNSQTVKSEILISTSTPSNFLKRISEKYHLPLLVNSEQKGIAADWTYAFNNCQTEYVTLAHQDDLYMNNYTEKCLQSAGSFKNNLIIFTDYIELFNGRIRANNLLLNVKRLILYAFYVFRSNLSSDILKKAMISFGNPVCCPSIMYNRKRIGNFEFDKSFSMNLDWEASLRLSAMKGDFIYLKKKLLTRRIHKASESTNALMNNIRIEEDRKLFEKFWPKPIVEILLKIYYLAYISNSK